MPSLQERPISKTPQGATRDRSRIVRSEGMQPPTVDNDVLQAPAGQRPARSGKSLQQLQADESRRVTSADTSAAIIVKSLLYPLICVFTLIASLLIAHQALTGRYCLIAVLAFLGSAEVLDYAQIRPWHDWKRAVAGFCNLTIRWLLLVTFIYLIMHICHLEHDFDREMLLSWVIATPFALWIGQETAGYFLVNSKTLSHKARKAVIVGATEHGMRLENTLREDHTLRTKVVGYFDDRAAARLPIEGSQMLGTCASLAAFVAAEGISVVYITLPMHIGARVAQLLDALRDSTASIYFVPDLFVFNLIQARFDLLRGIPLVAVCETPFFGMRGMAKRAVDILVSGLGILMSAPLLLLLALMIRISSPGPIVFRQKRYGLDGKPITVYKFRSMSVTEDGATTYTQVSRNDTRVTTIGALMRKTSLDELPQLFNVFEGSMSIIGPRPHAVAVNEQYRRLIPGYMIRHKIKPGITGWAQVNGYRGGDDLPSMQKRIEYDLDYLNHWSLRFDFLILLKTAFLVLRDKKAY